MSERTTQKHEGSAGWSGNRGMTNSNKKSCQQEEQQQQQPQSPAKIKKQQLKQEQQKKQPPFPLYRNSGKPTFDEGWLSVVNSLLRGKKRIVVLAGAGISVSCGIPDFRSKGTGLYSTLDAEEVGLSCPEELFDFEVFQENPQPFFNFAKNLYFPLGTTERVRPSDSHKLLAMLEQRKILQRVYSQNIDGLEEQAGVSSKKVVYAHGSLQWATCCKCRRKVNASEIESDILNGTVARCQAPKGGKGGSTGNGGGSLNITRGSSSRTTPASPTLVKATRQLSARSRKRPRALAEAYWENSSPSVSKKAALAAVDATLTAGNTDINLQLQKQQQVCYGVMKPCVTFFGEALNDNVRRCLEADRNKVDALIVIGTSLSVAPISKVIGYLPPNIPRILINRTIVHPASHFTDECDDNDDKGQKDFRKDYVFDAYLLGFCDEITRALARQLFAESPTNTSSSSSPASPPVKSPVTTISSDLKPLALLNGKLLATVDENDEHYRLEDWSSSRVPPERIFLFPGAQPPSVDPYGCDDPSELTYREVAHCDGCSERIMGIIRKCVACFDYDLCHKCFPTLSKTHYDGAHQFAEEAAAINTTTTGSISGPTTTSGPPKTLEIKRRKDNKMEKENSC